MNLDRNNMVSINHVHPDTDTTMLTIASSSLSWLENSGFGQMVVRRPA